MGEGGQVDLEDIIVVVLVDHAQHPRIPAHDVGHGILGGVLGKLLVEVFVAQPILPESLGLGQIARPGELLAVEDEPVVAGEIPGPLFEQADDIIVLLIQPLAKPVEDQPGRGGGAALQSQVVQLESVFLKLIEIGLKKVEVQVVHRVQVPVQELRGYFVVDGGSEVMLPLEDPGDELHNRRIVWPFHQGRHVRVTHGQQRIGGVQVGCGKGCRSLACQQKKGWQSHVKRKVGRPPGREQHKINSMVTILLDIGRLSRLATLNLRIPRRSTG